MAANIADIDAGVVVRIQDAAAVLNQATRYAHIASALAEYQRLRPRQQVTALAGAGVYDYLTSLLTGFEDGFSYILQIDGPVLAGAYIPPRLDPGEYAIVRTPAGLFLRFTRWAPNASETYHVTVACRHTLTAGTSTVLAVDDEALMDLAAHYCANALAAYYSQSTEGSLQADTVDHGSKVELYRSIAKDSRASYELKIKLPDTSSGYRWVERA